MIETAVGHQTMSDKNVICLALIYQSKTFCPALYDWVSYVENPLKVKTGLEHHVAYYKSIIKHFAQLYSKRLNENTLVVVICHYLLLL